MWWLSHIVKYGKDKDESRINRNIQGTSLEVPDMVLLVKDHKDYKPGMSGVVPTRPVVSGSRGINTHLSEWLSEILEPVANSMGSGEIASTEEAVHHLDRINDEVRASTDTPHDDILLHILNKNEAAHIRDQNSKLKQWDELIKFDKENR